MCSFCLHIQNKFSNLDFTALINLTELHIENNYEVLNSLNLSGLTNLKKIYCQTSILLNINLNGLENLNYLDCYGNFLSALDISTCLNLKELSCSKNKLMALDISNNVELISLNCSNNKLENLNLVGQTKLTNLYCFENKLLSLDFKDLLNIEKVNCSGNLLTNTNIDNLDKLKYIDISLNKLSSLTLSNLPNFDRLDCPDNLISTLILTKLPNLTTLLCDKNMLTNVDLLELTNLNFLRCSSNKLSSLNLKKNVKITQLICNNNLLQTLDVSGLFNLSNLDCSYNNLSSLFIKNGKNDSNLYFDYNPYGLYVCADDSEINYVLGFKSSYKNFAYNVNSYCNFVPGGVFYAIQGKNKLDRNNNGCDVLDINYPNLKLSFSDGINSGDLISDSSGNYHYEVQAGTHTISPKFENPLYFTISPTTANVTFPTQSSPFIQDFCVTANGLHPDLEVSLLPISRARPGFDATYKIIYKNKGNQVQSGSANLTFDDAVLDFVSSIPETSSQSNNNIFWNFTNLKPFESKEITFTLNVNAPTENPAVNNDDVLVFAAKITSLVTDETPKDNEFTLSQTVVGSYDPNDKTCLEGSIITPNLIGEYVRYMIRFENKGTYSAQNIVVMDRIDLSKFDISTLIPTSSSHSFTTKISEGNKVEFIFENINLPFDDANNDGYVAFKIKTLPTLVVGDSFANEASIFFDYNFPIVTNKATSTFKTLGTKDFDFSNYFSLYPNPANEVLNIATTKTIEVQSIAVYDILGQLVLALPNVKSVSKIDVSQLSAGNYFLKMNTDKGTSNMKFIKN
jgi:Leucine-rich repeat (LRR) protein